MNKKIKVIDLFNKRAKKEQMPYKIEYGGEEYQLEDFMYINTETKRSFGEDFDLELCLFSEVEILEDNTEEQESLGESWKEVGKRVGEWAKEFEQGFKESFTEIVTCPFKKLENNTEDIEELKHFTSLDTPTFNENDLENRIDALLEKNNKLLRALNELNNKINNI